jgi:hypothetical protein
MPERFTTPWSTTGRLTYPVRIDDSAGDQNRNVHRRTHLFEQFQCRSRAPDMPAGLHSLRNHTVRARGSRRSRFLDRPALVNPGGRGKPARNTPERHDHIGGGGRGHIAGTHERQQQVHRDRASGESPGGGHFGGDRSARAGNRSETTLLRHCRRQFVTRNGAHTGLHDRHIQAA